MILSQPGGARRAPWRRKHLCSILEMVRDWAEEHGGAMKRGCVYVCVCTGIKPEPHTHPQAFLSLPGPVSLLPDRNHHLPHFVGLGRGLVHKRC